ncbi:Cyclin-dependent kinases regulatory subunit, partial [Gryllus bimaculatus]
MARDDIYYSPKYYDDTYEYRHVVLPKELVKLVPRTHLMSEAEWRRIGVQQSEGWVHYMTHQPDLTSDSFKTVTSVRSEAFIASHRIPGDCFSLMVNIK